MENDRNPEPRRWIRVMDNDLRDVRRNARRAAREEAIQKAKEIRDREKAERREALWQIYDVASTVCLNCYGMGHRRPCSEPGIIACSKCFVVNHFTISCNCYREENERIKPTCQVYRMAGDPEKPLFYMDVMITFRTFEAQVSTGQTTTTINHHLAKWLDDLTDLVVDNNHEENAENTMMVPINHRGQTIRLSCNIVRYQEQEIILGTDYLMKKGFTSIVDNIKLNQNSIVLSHPREIQFVYNLPGKEPLRRFVRTHGGKLRNSRIYDMKNWPTDNEEQAAEPYKQEDCIRIDADEDVEEVSKM